MKTFDAIAVLGGGIVQDENGRWRTTNFDENDNFGALGDRLRVVAAGYLYKTSRAPIIALGGRGQLKNIAGAPPVSDVIKDELIEAGVKADDIILERNSGNTFQQLQELGKIIKNKNLNSVAIVSNRYHLPRVKAMLGHNLDLKKLFSGSKLFWESAEDTLLERAPEKWGQIISPAYESKAMKKRMAQEMAGARQIKDGTYNY